MPAQPRHNPEIDRLRAVAVLLVVFVHLPSYLFLNQITWPAPFGATWSGVELFFVISGYVVTGMLAPPLFQASAERSRHPYRLLAWFYVRRIFRLLPASWTWIAVILLCARYFNSTGGFGDFKSLQRELLPITGNYYNFFYYLLNTGHLGWHWSLSVEEQFYILFPFVIIMARTRARLALFAAGYVVIMTFVARPLLASGLDMESGLLRYSSAFKFDCILAGSLLGLLASGHPKQYRKLLPGGLRRTSVGYALTLALCAITAAAPQIFRGYPSIGYPVILLCCVALVYLASLEEGLCFPKGRPGRILDWFGKRSYTLYLTHIPSIWLTREVSARTSPGGFDPIQLLLAFALLTGLLTEATYQLIEKPLIAAGRRISERLLASERPARRKARTGKRVHELT
jgi:peptidoglycan/LPS O-acetylase OafA/YrhL